MTDTRTQPFIVKDITNLAELDSPSVVSANEKLDHINNVPIKISFLSTKNSLKTDDESSNLLFKSSST